MVRGIISDRERDENKLQNFKMALTGIRVKSERDWFLRKGLHQLDTKKSQV
jgi:hypothetical protein